MFDFPLCLAKVLPCFSNSDALLTLFQANTLTKLFYGCEILRSPMISYLSQLYSTTILYDIYMYVHGPLASIMRQSDYQD